MAWDEEQLTAWRSLRNQEIATALTETEALEVAIREPLNTPALSPNPGKDFAINPIANINRVA